MSPDSQQGHNVSSHMAAVNTIAKNITERFGISMSYETRRRNTTRDETKLYDPDRKQRI